MPVVSLQALVVPGVQLLAGPGALALGKAGVVYTSALAPVGLLGAARRGSCGRLGRGGGAGGDDGSAGGDGDEAAGAAAAAAAGHGVAGGLGGEDGRDRGPGGLLVEGCVVEERVALAAEGLGDPAVLVGVRPNGDTDAAGHIEARADDVGIVVTLSDSSGGGGRQGRVADIELSVGDLDAESGEALQGGGEARTGGGAADDEMALEANTIDLCARCLHGLDQLDGKVGLGAVVLQVVVVVVQLGVGVGGLGGLEGKGKVVSAEGLEEDAVSPDTRVIDGLVDDIPGVALALVVAHDVVHVRLNDGLQGSPGPRAGRDPVGQLAVPDLSMASQALAVRLGRVGRDVSCTAMPVRYLFVSPNKLEPGGTYHSRM